MPTKKLSHKAASKEAKYSQIAERSDYQNRFRSLRGTVEELMRQRTFDKNMLNKAAELREFLDRSSPEALARLEADHLMSRSMLAEVYDYFGDSRASCDSVKEGPKILSQLPTNIESGAHLEDRKIIRERIRYCLDYAQAAYYRTHQYAQAKQVVEKCRKLVFAGLRIENKFPCNGTLGKIMYYLGRIERQTNNFDAAIQCFDQAIRYFCARAEQKRNAASLRTTQIKEEIDNANYKTAICVGLGIGWVDYNRGLLASAATMVSTAKVMLVATEDEINKAYLDLLDGSITRSLAGNDPIKLAESIRLVEKALATFKKHGHVSYLGRASYELALGQLYLGNLSLCAAALHDLKESIKPDDHRWLCKSLIVESRMERRNKQASRAEELANEAFGIAQNFEQEANQSEALIARAESRINQGLYQGACEDLKLAIEIGTSGGSGVRAIANPKVEAVCNIHLARAYARQRDRRRALQHFDRWLQLQSFVEHRLIHNLGKEVQNEINSLRQDFVISVEESHLNYEEHEKNLRKWLVDRAKDKDTEKQKIAQDLGISRQTLYTWEKEAETSKNS